MYTETLRSIVGIEIFPVISLLLFVAVFASVLVWAVRADRDALDRHALLPFDGPGLVADRPTQHDTAGGLR